MKKNKFIHIFIYILIVCLFIITGIYPVFAYVMESSNYRIQSDSLNVGGVRQTSDNYIMRDTIGEVATGLATSDNYKLKAGYQQMQEVYLSISDCSDFTMTGSPIGGMTGGTAAGSCTWTVKTDNAAGFSMSLKASTDPAMEGATYTIADYTETLSGTPDYSWSVAGGAAEFGYTVEPATTADAVAKFLDDGSDCGVGSGQVVDKCWIDFATADYTVINRGSRTGSSGEAEVIKFKAEVGNTSMQEGDTYDATITATAVTN